MEKYKKIVYLEKEIELIKEDFEDIEASVLLNKKELKEVEKQKKETLNKLIDLYNKLNKEIEEIENEEERLIIRYRIKGYTYRKIGKKMGYTGSAIAKKLNKFKNERVEKVDKIHDKI